MPSATRRLPGIRFEAATEPLAEALPRMDVAVFVGFAARGPAHLPVAVEDFDQYRSIFGADVVLCRDREQNELVRGQLPSAVRLFFANGGRRCWVVRVLDEALVRANRFQVPGLWSLGRDATGQPELVPALAEACSFGSWSDGVSVASALLARALRWSPGASSTLVRVEAPPGTLEPGDLLRFSAIEGDRATFALVRGVTQDGDVLGIVLEPCCSHSAGRFVALQIDPSDHLELLRFELTAGRGDDDQRASELGFCRQHPRFWGSLLVDDQTRYGAETLPPATSATAGFPVCARPSTADVFLPIDMGGLFGARSPAESEPSSPLERDGLAQLSSALFLDPELAAVPISRLSEVADELRYFGPLPRRLRGVHAALGFRDRGVGDEATLICVPDATQRGWSRWTEACLLEPWLPAPAAVVVPPSADTFSGCGPVPVPIPRLTVEPVAPAENTDDVLLKLSIESTGAGTLVVEEAFDPAFQSASEVARASGPLLGLDLLRRPGTYYYRARLELAGRQGDASSPVGVEVLQRWELRAAAPTAVPLLDVQRALLRLCATRGDLFALLALPAHFRESEAVAHLTRLRATHDREGTVPALGAGEEAAFSYAAAYFPWLAMREEGELLLVAPDGPVSGMLAKRALKRGAWVAPANEPLSQIVSVVPKPRPARAAELLEAQLNTIGLDPFGISVSGADTLSRDPDLRPINVRRLLALLRRAALARGVDYVFEPLGDELLRLVRRGFEGLLGELHRRGAFAGERPETAFRVELGSPATATRDLDQGRLVVELKVAPATPLRFLTLRLTRAGERLAVSEGVSA